MLGRNCCTGQRQDAGFNECTLDSFFGARLPCGSNASKSLLTATISTLASHFGCLMQLFLGALTEGFDVHAADRLAQKLTLKCSGEACNCLDRGFKWHEPSQSDKLERHVQAEKVFIFITLH